jgi:hypothetical protein
MPTSVPRLGGRFRCGAAPSTQQGRTSCRAYQFCDAGIDARTRHHRHLGREPAERVRHLTHDRFNRVAALGLLGAVGLRAIVVGETAGALHGWPLILSDEGTLDLLAHPEDRGLAEETVLAAAAAPERVRVIDAPPGTYGFADLARAEVEVTVDGIGRSRTSSGSLTCSTVWSATWRSIPRIPRRQCRSRPITSPRVCTTRPRTRPHLRPRRRACRRRRRRACRGGRARRRGERPAATHPRTPLRLSPPDKGFCRRHCPGCSGALGRQCRGARVVPHRGWTLGSAPTAGQP